MLKKLSSIVATSCCVIAMGITGTIAAQASDPLVGDVDGNGIVDTLDAAEVLVEAAALGSSDTSHFVPDQVTCADVNMDNLINAVDAALITSYSSYTGSGGTLDMLSYLNQLTQGEPETEEPPASSAPVSDGITGNIVSMTADEAKMLAALVTLEAQGESYECQKAVASLVINRMLTSNLTVEGVIYQKNQFSTASRVASTTPTDSCMNAVNDVLTNGTTLPIYVTFFRAGYYHSWGDQVAYCCMDNTYFSYSQALKNQYV